MSGWLQRNRWWLVAVPVTLALMLAASAYRVKTFWWDNGLHSEQARVEAGEWAEASEEFYDPMAGKQATRTYEVRLEDVREVESLPSTMLLEDDRTVPDGVDAYRVRLRFRADPETDLFGCRMILVGDDGVRYGDDSTVPLDQSPTCEPAGQSEDEKRPEEFSTERVVLTAEDADLDEVWVTFSLSDYVALELP